MNLVFITHALPLWFLVLSLFLPRLCLLIAWVQSALGPFHLAGFVPLLVALLVPRLLILFLIYQDQGVSLWFLIHLVGLLLAWGGGSTRGTRVIRRRRDRDRYETVD